MKKLTKARVQGFITAHARAKATSLNDIYSTYSYQKQRAYNYCLEMFKKYNGVMFKIISYNTFAFSVAFYGVNPETGVVQFIVITKNYDYYYDIDKKDIDNL